MNGRHFRGTRTAPPPKNGSPNLSPERVRAGASSRTEIVNEQVQHNLRFIYLSHWLRKNAPPPVRLRGEAA